MQEKNKEISARLQYLIDFLHVTPQEFARKLGYPRAQNVYDMLSGKAKPSFQFWEKFFNSEYSEKINGIWLITGKGSMSTNNGFVVVQEPSTNEVKDLQTELIAAQRKIIELQSELLQVMNNNKKVS